MPRSPYFTFEEGKKILENNCQDSIKSSEVDLADFTFRNSIQALTFAAYTNSIIPIDDKVGFQLIETGGIDGGGDVSCQFYKNLFLLRNIDKTNSVSESRLGALSHPLHEFFREFNDYLTIEKHLIFVERHSLSKVIKSIVEKGHNPSNFVLYVADGTLGEDFYNYPTIEHFKSEGYFTGFWTPRYGADLIAVRIPEYQKQLEENGFIKGGASFFELELAPLGDLGHPKEHHFFDRYDMVYMEVENDVNLALSGGSKNGIGQKAGLASPKSEVYGVGPVSDIASYIPKPGEKFGDRYKKAQYGYGRILTSPFGYPDRLGAIIFDRDGNMEVINSDDRGFDEEDETISDYKNFLKIIFLNKLPIKKAKQLTNAHSLDEFIRKTQITEFSTILTALKQ